ncbi:MAG: hypothetical protein HY585_04625 [Candidatus Omnitrophica bacterium]|nr:hypothetical protein [Candidatus Omnitrophota bacterium]
MTHANENRKTRSNARKLKPKLGLFLCGGITGLLFFSISGPSHATDIPKSSTISEELNLEEKQNVADQLLVEGDRLAEAKNYDLANATYESIFLLDPHHVAASKRIDRLKKQMKQEGRSETELVTRVYDAEIDMRVSQYLTEAKELMAAQKWGKARFTLQKLLLINPLNEEGRQLYAEVNQEFERQVHEAGKTL